MDVVTPPPVLTPTCVVADQASPRQPPKARVVKIYGLIGPEHKDFPIWKSNWLPPGDDELSSYVATPGSRLLGEQFSEAVHEQEAGRLLKKLNSLGRDELFALWAQDIAGAVVKLALIIAAQEPQYRHILDRTHAIIFFGTPHRASDTHSLDSTIISVMEECYTGLFADWVPSTVNKISRHLERVDERFSFISHMFAIISYYQAPPPSPTAYTIVVPEASATLGLENEIRIGSKRVYHGLSHYMTRYEENLLQSHLINAKIAHWDNFRHFMAVLDSSRSRHDTEYPELPLLLSSRTGTACFKDSRLADWASSNTSHRYAKIRLGDQIDPFKVLVSVARAIQKCPEALWNSCPAINTVNNQDNHGEADIYLGLLKQIATQQPRVFLHMQHLMPILTDAISSHSKSWRERGIWVCLMTAIHAPIGIPTYGFLHIKTPASFKVLQSIDSCLRDTDSLFRLVLTFADGVQLGVDEARHFELDLKPEDVEVCTEHPNPLLISDCLPLQILSLRVRTLGRPTFVMLTWIAFAMRPLSVEELDLILALDNAKPNRESLVINIQHGLAVHLLKIISETTEINLGRIFLRVSYPQMRRLLSGLSSMYLGTTASPHLHLAQSCSSFLLTHVFNSTKEKGAGDSEGANEETGEEANAAQDVPPNQPNNYKVAIDEMTAPQRALAEYAARNWIIHYRLAMTSHHSSKHHDLEPFLSFVEDRTCVHRWLYLVEHLSFPPYQSDGVTSSDSELVESFLSLDKLEDLETRYQLASRPLPLSWPGRLLIRAAELGDKATVISLVTKLDVIEPGAIARAVAATCGDIHEALRASVMPILKDRYWQTMAQAQLTAQVLGNVTTSNNIRDELLSMTTWPGLEAWFSDALDLAVEYGDEKALNELLANQNLRRRIAGQDEESRWTPIHRAAYYGNLACMTKVWEAGVSLNVLSPDGRRPLFISSARGFASIVHFLALNGAHMDSGNGKNGETALHAAGFHGHWETTKTLLDNGADVTVADTHGDFSLHLAIQQGHSHVAELVIDRFPIVTDVHGPFEHDETIRSRLTDPSFLSNDEAVAPPQCHKEEPSVGTDAEYSETSPPPFPDDSALAPLDMANSDGMTVLFAAADRDLPSVGKCLLERGADPNIIDDKARTVLHLAAKAGRADLIKELIAKGSVTNQVSRRSQSIPLHFACYRGHADVIEFLTGTISDLTSEDRWERTPLAAACARGQLQTVKALARRYDNVQRAKGLMEAARNGYCKVANYLLDLGCPVNESGTDGESALLSAVRGGHPRMVEQLILRGADTGHKDSSGDCAILLSTRRGLFEVTKILVDSGARLDIEGEDGESPLGRAIYSEHPVLVRLLLERGARMRLPTRWNRYSSLLDFSWGLSKPPVTEVLLHFYTQGKHEDHLTPTEALITALGRGSSKLLKLVLDIWFASDTVKHASAGKALHYAASKGRLALLKQLLEHPAGKAAINGVEPGYGTPLHAAISAGADGKKINLLVEMGANADITSGRYGTILNAACVAAKLETIKICLKILRRDLVLSVSGKYGTAIQSAVVGFRGEPPEKCIEVLELLEKSGVTPLAVGGRYFTALHAAARYEAHEDVVAWLTKRSSRSLLVIDIAGRLPLHLAIMRKSWSQVEEIWENTKRTSQRLYQMSWEPSKDNQGLNILHYAAISESADRVTEILTKCSEEGFDASRLINQPDLAGWTPLHWACRLPRKEVIQTLVNRGADPQARTKDGWTPRHIAVVHGTTDSEELEPLPEPGDKGVGLPDGPGAYYGGCCDVCYLPRRWKYYHCTDEECDDYDLCFKCYMHVEDVHHDGHEFKLGLKGVNTATNTNAPKKIRRRANISTFSTTIFSKLQWSNR
ncbi:hypothetical protein DL766_007922 [Monosporascus sp. MC13-8B]|uniref:ZZ-type domain-containing protein n=1 Tax=Monosporascus cannonballus TaxID=155416 RepID=A0ABY0H5N0_9PEZI|nr:hypothetical protein DL762_005381 [Monosporascus cannonballus]RYO86853.1 hypothetical protein DL763_006561 [Monosporascus cannonballus]RYP21449.1 hypothetical protein DL766_007922 [Monosporascus sp. MC13-8B]